MGEPLGDDEYMADIHRGSTGFGFNIKGTVQEGGVMQAINGRLFPPLQYVSFVDKGTNTSMLHVLTCLPVAVGAAYSGGCASMTDCSKSTARMYRAPSTRTSSIS